MASELEIPMRNIPTKSIRRNENNPRRFFNDESLDILRTSIQEVGILVPLIVFEDPHNPGTHVLMDGERRWRSALDLAVAEVPANIIPPPSPLDNLLRMFNIHSVRDEWPLVSVALSLREVMRLSGEDRETRLSEMTGLTRSTVRRARRLLSLPQHELDLIQAEAHLERASQVHREDLYLEVEAAVSVIRNEFPEIADTYSREKMIREFVRKRELGKLDAVTDYRYIGRIIKAADEDVIPREVVQNTLVELIVRPEQNPRVVFEEVAARAYEQQAVGRKAELLAGELSVLETTEWSGAFLAHLRELREAIDRILREAE